MEMYRYATMDDLELLVNIRLKDLKMYSSQPIENKTIDNIRNFYRNGMNSHTLKTLLCYQEDLLIGHATVYVYQVMPSNSNQTGIVGQITNVFVDQKYRHKGIGAALIEELTKDKNIGLYCLNSSKDAMEFYKKLGFQMKDNYMCK